ncbi:hypothetical protein D3C85_1070710 [compost metagenome]
MSASEAWWLLSVNGVVLPSSPTIGKVRSKVLILPAPGTSVSTGVIVTSPSPTLNRPDFLSVATAADLSPRRNWRIPSNTPFSFISSAALNICACFCCSESASVGMPFRM